ncbi:MAG TPA: PQQ-dependent sugar dehydrogenase [Stellaceae bacterium]|nr:PQQ-dependent sugar dehydrogenase [Stellaceae bacterium]
MMFRNSVGALLAAACAAIVLPVAGSHAQTAQPPAAAPAAPPVAAPAAPPATPAAAPPPAAQAPTLGGHVPQAEGQPSWREGMTPEQASSPLHPNIPNMLGHPASEIKLDQIKLPPGFKIELWAGDLQEARSMALGAKGTLFVGQRVHDGVFAIIDKGDHREVKKILSGLNSPNGVAFANGTLFVAERERILRYDDIENHLDNPPAPKVVIDGLPHQDGHFWKFMVMGPDGWLYFNQGSPTNLTMPSYVQAAILRVQPDKHIMEIYAQGVRNSVGMAFSPLTRQLWFTDNGRDWLGEDEPSDELNHAAAKGENFGYPFCHQGDILDPVYGKYASCDDFVPPDVKLGPHVASLGMRFYTGKMFPPDWKNNIIIAEHGSWNRTVKSGYNLTRIVLNPAGTKVVRSEVFLSGLLDGQNILERLVDVQVMPDGALLASDDWNGAVYRITYKKP